MYIQETFIGSHIYNSIVIYIHFVQFVHCVYIQKTCKDSFSQLVVQILYSVYIVCICKKHTFQVSSPFSLHLRFVQLVHFLCIVRNLKYISSAFIITPNVDLYNLCIQNICKFSALYDFSIHFLQLCKFFSIGPQCNSSYIHSERNRECPFCVPGHK